MYLIHRICDCRSLVATVRFSYLRSGARRRLPSPSTVSPTGFMTICPNKNSKAITTSNDVGYATTRLC